MYGQLQIQFSINSFTLDIRVFSLDECRVGPIITKLIFVKGVQFSLLPLWRKVKASMTQKNRNLILWKKMLKGDLTALEQLYAFFYTDLYHYAIKITEQEYLAEDAVQDVFVDLWNYRNQITTVYSPKFYLIRSLRNQCLKLLKKQNRFTDLTLANPFEITILPEELKLREDNQVVKKAIKKALEQLSPRQREIIYLKFYNNLDYEELAEILEINYQSVVNHIHKAMLKLRKAEVIQHFKY